MELKCIDASNSDHLIVNSIYHGRPHHNADKYWYVTDESGVERSYYAHRFVVVESGTPPALTLSGHKVGGGMKYDGNKPRMDLLLDGCPNALEAVGKVLTFGAQKYADHSWQTVSNGDTRYKAALLRHLLALSNDQRDDPESGLHHLAHVACNALFILELALRDKDEL